MIIKLTLLICIFYWHFAKSANAQDKTAEGIFGTQADCNAKCRGMHDSGCFEINGGAACRCMAGYYSVKRQCEKECEDNQFWSLFTYGSCTNVDTYDKLAGGEGLCKQMCSFRVRVWATVFIIILFVSAVTLLILMLPGCITSCYTCIALKKQHRREKEDAAMASVGADPHGSIIKPGSSNPAVHPGYSYPFYQGWPQYYR